HFGNGLDFVAYALANQRNAQLGGPTGYDGAFAAGNQRDSYTALAQQAQAMAIEGIEALDHFAMLAIPKAAVGQYAVYVEGHEAHLAGTLCDGGRDFGQYQGLGGMGEFG